MFISKVLDLIFRPIYTLVSHSCKIRFNIISYLHQDLFLLAVSPSQKKNSSKWTIMHEANFQFASVDNFKFSAVCTSVYSTSWTPRGNAYPLLSRHFAPYHVISKLRVREHNTGPITVLILLDSYSLHQLPYEGKEGTRPNVYWTVHHCNSWGIRNQLDVTYYVYYT